MEDLKANFLKRYASLPSGARNEIIAIVNNDAFTWRTAKIEIDENTSKSKVILSLLKVMEIL